MTNSPSHQSAAQKSKLFYGYVVVALAFIIMSVMYITRSAFGVFFKPMLEELDWTRAAISGAVSLSLIIQGSLAIIMGGLNDRLGPRLVLTLCNLLLVAGLILMSQIHTIWHMYVFYGLMIGIGMSGCLVPLLSTVARWFVKWRNVMSGIVVAGIGVGSLIAPPIANHLITIYDWRLAYIILGTFILFIATVSIQFVKREPAQIGQMPYNPGNTARRELKRDVTEFSLRETMHTGRFWMTSGIFFCLGFSMFSIMVHLVPHVTDLDISPVTAAAILAAMGGVSIIGNVVAGPIADRIGNRYVCVISLLIMAVTLIWLIWIVEIWMFYLFAVLFGFFSGTCVTTESPIAAELFGLKSHGSILGFISFSFTVGAAVGPLLMGYIFDVKGSYQIAFLIGAAVSLAGTILSIALKPATE